MKFSLTLPAADRAPARSRCEVGVRRYYRLCFMVVACRGDGNVEELRSALVTDDDVIPADGAQALFAFSTAFTLER